MNSFYNDNDPFVCRWLENLIAAEYLPPGDVLCSDIRQLDLPILDAYGHCHFFAGIGGWPLALRLAGWPGYREVWTGSCPCQPFSQAGKRAVDKDERHLWPAFRAAIAERRPATVFGEQVAGKDGRIWLAGVRADLEALGYAVGAADLCAASVGAPMRSQRLHWVATTNRTGLRSGHQSSATSRHGHSVDAACRDASGMGQANGERHAKRMGNGNNDEASNRPPTGQAVVKAGAWADFAIALFEKGERRRFEPSAFPLAHGFPGRVGRIRAYGNAIVPQVAAEFVRAFLDCGC